SGWAAPAQQSGESHLAGRGDPTGVPPAREGVPWKARPNHSVAFEEMPERLGIVGLPNAGKSSLFNALTGGSAVVAPHPFSTTETTLGVAQVPDDRLTRLSAMSQSKKTVPATVEFVDIAGLVAGSSTGEGLGN